MAEDSTYTQELSKATHVLEKLLRAVKSSQHVEVVIPTEWENFLDTDARWVKIKTHSDDKGVLCQFWAPKGFKFTWHFHETLSEDIFVLGGPVRVTSRLVTRVLHHGECIHIPKDTSHTCKWLQDATLIISFRPPSEVWEATPAQAPN